MGGVRDGIANDVPFLSVSMQFLKGVSKETANGLEICSESFRHKASDRVRRLRSHVRGCLKTDM